MGTMDNPESIKLKVDYANLDYGAVLNKTTIVTKKKKPYPKNKNSNFFYLHFFNFLYLFILLFYFDLLSLDGKKTMLL